MNEALIYLGNNLNTKQLRSASYELNNWCLDVVDYCSFRVKQVDPRKPDMIPLALRIATGSGNLPTKTRDRWQTAEERLFYLLRSVTKTSSPAKVALKLSELLQPIPPFRNYQEAFLFFDNTENRVLFLLSPEGQARLDSLKIVAASYIESLVLRRAVFEGVYLTKPKNH